MFIFKSMTPPDLSALGAIERKRLKKLIARVSEASYRRGLQQGKVFAEHGAFRADPGRWRFARSLDATPCGETGEVAPWCKTSLERLQAEHSEVIQCIEGANISGP